MACNCDTYIKKCVRMNPCNVGTYLGIDATETGTWTGIIEFSGASREFGVEVEDGEEISILTSLLNENYVHKLELYDTANELVACYKLHTQLTQSVSGAPVPPVASGNWDWHSLQCEGSDVESVYLTGEISPIIWLDSNPLEWENAGIIHTPETGTLNFAAIGGFTGTLSFQYRNLP